MMTMSEAEGTTFYIAEANISYSSVITVHGIRDDRNTAWTTRTGTPWLRDQLFEDLSIRQLDYSYSIDSPATVFQPDGIRTEALNLLHHYSEERCSLPDVCDLTCYEVPQD
jgi:hypothetical protein